MTDFWLTEAVSNNAVWCDAVAASHGVPTIWNESVWLSELPMPRLYPNIITLRSGAFIDEHIDALGPRLPLVWGIKDSFSELELDDKGFTLVFKAHWYYRPPNQHLTKQCSQRVRVETVQTQSELHVSPCLLTRLKLNSCYSSCYN